MKKSLTAILMITAIGALFSAFYTAPAPNSDYAGVEKAVQYYFDGLDTSDASLLKKAFFEEAQLMAIRNGEYWEVPFEKWVGNFGPKKASGGDKKYEITSIDIAGNAALVKTHLDYPNVTYLDYLALLKFDDTWKIVNKSFHAIPK